MRFALFLLIALAACNTPGPQFFGIEPVARSAGGSDFLIRLKGNLAEVIRTSPEWSPKYNEVSRRAAMAVEAESGCQTGWIEGDASLMIMGLSCNGAAPPDKPVRPVSFTCYPYRAFSLSGDDPLDFALECLED
ncbi:hypothetical protein [Aestuariicoccus sp. MJ-SS9]|uniref:hypothetical protein n=1 Tax=Aestuariicoccus sp. MJ-SS9 TaxID=3079855 RepID=UPI00292DEFCF|nr:hypothetical protein [Aestuariicoccus sp. MJ-SS9]